MKSLRVSLVAAGYLRSAWVGGMGIVTLACGLAWSAAPESHPQKDPGGAPPPAAAGRDFSFQPVIPVDVEDGTGDFSFIHNPDNIPEAQRIFDRFAWRVFVGLNWPSNADGLPDPKITLRQDAEEGSWRPRVWQALAEVNELYKQFGAAPEPWNGGAFPGFDPGKIEPDTLWMYSKISNRHALNRTQILDESKQAFTGPLVDQQGKWVRYQVRLNRTAYEYVRQNGLYSLEGQAEFSRANILRFPRNGDRIGGKTFEFGTIEVKLAWKQLAEYDAKAYGPFKAGDYDLTTPDGYKTLAGRMAWNSDPSRFLVRWSRIIHNGATPVNGKPQPDPVPVPMGLVGMHISVKTRSSPQWIWTTFEQVDNVLADDLEHVKVNGKERRLRPTFNNPDLPTKLPNVLAPMNSKPDASGQPTDWDEALTTVPVQVTRVIPIPLATQRVNQDAQHALAQDKSVLQFYELIGAQWPVTPRSPAFPSGSGSSPESIVLKSPGRMVPVYVVNTTMETFFQKGVQPAGPLAQDDRLAANQVSDATPVFGTESCVGCHYSAGMCLGFKRDADGNLVYNDGNKVPIFGYYANGGHNGNADYSWLLQMKAQSTEPPKPSPSPEVEFRGKMVPRATLNDPGSDPEKNLPKK